VRQNERVYSSISSKFHTILFTKNIIIIIIPDLMLMAHDKTQKTNEKSTNTIFMKAAMILRLFFVF